MTSLLCPLSHCDGETPEHLFLGCSVSSRLWSMGPWPLNMEDFCGYPIHTWMKFIPNQSNLPREAQEEWPQMLLAVIITIDTI